MAKKQWADVLQHKKLGQARNRQDNLQNYWKRELPPIDFRGYDFRTTMIRREKRGATRILSLDRVLLDFSWEDRALLRATMTLQNPSKEKPLPIKEGFEIKVDWAVIGAKHYRNLWGLRVEDINRSASGGTVELSLVDELVWFANSKDDWSFKKGKKNQPAKGKRKKGWYAHQIAREVCRRYGIKVGRLAKGKHLITNLTEENASPLTIIAKAYKLDRDETGRKFVVSMRNGELNITQLKRSKDLLVVSENLVEAAISESIKDTFATVLEVQGSLKQGKRKHKKLSIEVRSGDAVMKRFGIIKDQWKISDPVTSEGAARQRAKRRLAHFQEPKKEVTLTLPGMPTVRRGDSILVDLPEEEFRQLVYVKDVSHSVSGGGDYTMEVTCQLTDFFEDKEGEKIREEQCEKARKKKRKPPSYCKDSFDPFAPRQPNRRDRPGLQDAVPVRGSRR